MDTGEQQKQWKVGSVGWKLFSFSPVLEDFGIFTMAHKLVGSRIFMGHCALWGGLYSGCCEVCRMEKTIHHVLRDCLLYMEDLGPLLCSFVMSVCYKFSVGVQWGFSLGFSV